MGTCRRRDRETAKARGQVRPLVMIGSRSCTVALGILVTGDKSSMVMRWSRPVGRSLVVAVGTLSQSPSPCWRSRRWEAVGLAALIWLPSLAERVWVQQCLDDTGVVTPVCGVASYAVGPFQSKALGAPQ